MKKILLIIFSMLFLLSFSQTREKDLRLVGSWQGSEKGNQEEGKDKYWVQQRFNDGTFIMLFVSVDESGEGKAIVDKGEWWTEGDKFYELHYNTKSMDTYFYEFLDEQHVKFKLDYSELDFVNSDYEFIDTKLLEGVDYKDSY